MSILLGVYVARLRFDVVIFYDSTTTVSGVVVSAKVLESSSLTFWMSVLGKCFALFVLGSPVKRKEEELTWQNMPSMLCATKASDT